MADNDSEFTEGFIDASDEMETVQEDSESTAQAALDNNFEVDAITSGGGTRVPNPNVQGQSVPSLEAANAAAIQRLGTVVDAISSRRQLARWIILQDHWYQHNIDYLSGTVEIAPHPEIRVGYRLDIKERGMSFYVEGVTHSYKANDGLTTSLVLTRGQPNNPFPVYVHPATNGFNPTSEQRLMNSRLNKFVIMPDPVAVRRSLALRNDSEISADAQRNFNLIQGNDPDEPPVNDADTKETLGTNEKYTSAETDYVFQLTNSEDRISQTIASIAAGKDPATPSGAGAGGISPQNNTSLFERPITAPRGGSR